MNDVVGLTEITWKMRQRVSAASDYDGERRRSLIPFVLFFYFIFKSNLGMHSTIKHMVAFQRSEPLRSRGKRMNAPMPYVQKFDIISSCLDIVVDRLQN